MRGTFCPRSGRRDCLALTWLTIAVSILLFMILQFLPWYKILLCCNVTDRHQRLSAFHSTFSFLDVSSCSSSGMNSLPVFHSKEIWTKVLYSIHAVWKRVSYWVGKVSQARKCCPNNNLLPQLFLSTVQHTLLFYWLVWLGWHDSEVRQMSNDSQRHFR